VSSLASSLASIIALVSS